MRTNQEQHSAEVIERVPGLSIAAARIKQQFRDALIEHSGYVREHGPAHSGGIGLASR